MDPKRGQQSSKQAEEPKADNSFDQLKHLEQLAKAVAAQVDSWQCDQCNKLFTKRKNLLRHQRTAHGEESHKCDVCGAKFARFDNLSRHKASHANKRPAPVNDENVEPPTKQACLNDHQLGERGKCSW